MSLAFLTSLGGSIVASAGLGEVPGYVAAEVGQLAGGLLVLLLLAGRIRTDERGFLSNVRETSWQTAMSYVAAGLAISELARLTVFLAANIDGQTCNLPLVATLLAGPIWYRPLLALSHAIVAPLMEEILFRYFLFGAIVSRIGVALAAGVSSGIWTLFHLPAPVDDVVGLWAVGCLLAWTMHRTSSLMPALLTHSAINLVAVSRWLLIATPA
jgi:membrane protease YdiL (CAAX protease family)